MSTSILLLLLLLLLHSVFNTASPMLPVPIPVQVSDPKSFLAYSMWSDTDDFWATCGYDPTRTYPYNYGHRGALRVDTCRTINSTTSTLITCSHTTIDKNNATCVVNSYLTEDCKGRAIKTVSIANVTNFNFEAETSPCRKIEDIIFHSGNSVYGTFYWVYEQDARANLYASAYMVEYADASCNESNIEAYVGQRICRSTGNTSVQYQCTLSGTGSVPPKYDLAREDFTVAHCTDPTHEHVEWLPLEECTTVVDARPAKSYQYFCQGTW